MNRPFFPNEQNIEEFAFKVRGRVDGERIDQYLGKRFPGYSRAYFQKLIKSGQVLVDDKKIRASSKIRSNQKICVSLPKLEPLHLKPENIPLEVIYEDEAVAAVNKPVGLVAHPSRGHMSGTLVNALLYYFMQLSDCSDVYRPGIVHRLDRDTSGVMLVAKTNHAHAHLAQQFEQRIIKKEYLALVEGNLDGNEGTIALPIAMDPRNRERMAVMHGGKQAITNYRVLARYPNHTLVHAFPKTGRTHQIRVHFKSQGHPLVGDTLYGAAPVLTLQDILHGAPDNVCQHSVQAELKMMSRQALHAWRISFFHPHSNSPIDIKASLAQDFGNTLKLLQTTWPSPEVVNILN